MGKGRGLRWKQRRAVRDACKKVPEGVSEPQEAESPQGVSPEPSTGTGHGRVVEWNVEALSQLALRLLRDSIG
jgi:hypothetical protein